MNSTRSANNRQNPTRPPLERRHEGKRETAVIIEMTRDIASAASMDAANRAMRKAGRVAWNADDYEVAVETFNKLWTAKDEAETRRQQEARLRSLR